MSVRERSAIEVFLVFLRLGLTSFGGPAAHLGYFREEIVVRRRWLDDAAYGDLVSLCQFLPGPASSQVGFSLGLIRAGYSGALMAWTGFTIPSALLLVGFAVGAGGFGGGAGGGVPDGMQGGILHGLMLVAVAIVAQAVWGMSRTLCPDRVRVSIAGIAALLIASSTSSIAQLYAIAMGAGAGWLLCQAGPSAPPGGLRIPVSRRAGCVALAMFFLLLLVLPSLQHPSQAMRLFNAVYRSGALTFGGGHVVLPLLCRTFVTTDWVTNDAFLAGYGAAQAVPGPLFTFAAYLGAVVRPHSSVFAGAALGLIGIFLPGLLILLGTLPFWEALRRHRTPQAMMRGINAAVVGLLGAALYNPLWTSAVHSSSDFAVVLIGCILLVAWRAPPLLIVVLGALAGAAGA